MLHRVDCRHYIGTHPCHFSKKCSDCECFEKIGKRVLIILFGRLGDVVISTSLIEAIVKKWNRVHITFLTEENASPLLSENPHIQKVYHVNWMVQSQLQVESFDLIINLDRSPLASSLMMLTNAKKRVGFGYNEQGSIIPLGCSTNYLFDINRNPTVRSSNKKAWAEIYSHLAGFPVNIDPPLPKIYLSDSERKASQDWRKKTLTSEKSKIVLICPGTHKRDHQKRWQISHWKELISLINRHDNYVVLWHTGPHEEDLRLEGKKISTIHNVIILDTVFCLRELIKRISAIDVSICCDSLALNVSMALQVKTIGLFGTTNPFFIQESPETIKIRSQFDCPPCHSRSCQHASDNTRYRPCMESITPDFVYKKFLKVIGGGER